MRALRMLDARKIAVVDCPDPRPEGDEVVVRIEAAPICGSDLHGLYQRPGEKKFIPGHEAAGTVAAVDGARRYKSGDRVMLLPFNPCGACEVCRAGRIAYCRNQKAVHGFSRDGFQAEYVRIPQSSLLPVPDWMSFDAASMLLDPVGTPYHAHRRIGTNASHIVAVFGLGPMGLGAVLVGAHLGGRVIGVDPVAYRRELAKKLGAAEVVDPSAGDAVARIRDLTRGYGVDRALECSGRPEPLAQALDLVRPMGHVALIGENSQATINPSGHIIHKDVCLSGSCCFPLGEYDAILRLCESGLRATDLITHRYTLEQGTEAYATFEAGNTGKVIFRR